MSSGGPPPPYSAVAAAGIPSRQSSLYSSAPSSPQQSPKSLRPPATAPAPPAVVLASAPLPPHQQVLTRESSQAADDLTEVSKDDVRELLALGLRLHDLQRLWRHTNVDMRRLPALVAELVAEEGSLPLARQASLGLELARSSDRSPMNRSPATTATATRPTTTSSTAADDLSSSISAAPPIADLLSSEALASALEAELDDPPERLCDPLMMCIMSEPMIISTGFIFDQTTLMDSNGRLRFQTCPMTRMPIESKAYPVVQLKKELVDFKLRRLGAILDVVEMRGNSSAKLLDVAKTLIESLGVSTYGHLAVRYWALALKSLDMPFENRLAVLRDVSAARKTIPEAANVFTEHMQYDLATVHRLRADNDLDRLAEYLVAMLQVYSVPEERAGFVRMVGDWLGKEDPVDSSGGAAAAAAGVDTADSGAKAEASSTAPGFPPLPPLLSESESHRLGKKVFTSSYGDGRSLGALEEALEAGGDPDWVDTTRSDGFTALIKSVNLEDVAAVRLLLRYGADPNHCSTYGTSPLVYACGKGCTPVIKLLLQWGADPSIRPRAGQHQGNTADSLCSDNEENLALLASARAGELGPDCKPRYNRVHGGDGDRAIALALLPAPPSPRFVQTPNEAAFAHAFWRKLASVEPPKRHDAAAAFWGLCERACGRDRAQRQALLSLLQERKTAQQDGGATFTVSGAGVPGCNGSYVEDGTYHDMPLYKCQDNPEWWLLNYRLPSGNRYWYIAHKDMLDRDEGDLYRIRSDAVTPPIDGASWQCAKDGRPPCPTISRPSNMLGPMANELYRRLSTALS